MYMIQESRNNTLPLKMSRDEVRGTTITNARVLQPEFAPGNVAHRDAAASHLSDDDARGYWRNAARLADEQGM